MVAVVAAAAIAVPVVVIMEAVILGAVVAESQFPAAAAAAAAGCAAGTPLARVSGRQDRCKAPCSCLDPSSKPCLGGTWVSTCSKGHSYSDWTSGYEGEGEDSKQEMKEKMTKEF